MQTAGYPFPDYLQTSKCAINVVLESGIRGRQCVDTAKGGVMLHCLRLSAGRGVPRRDNEICDCMNGRGSLPAFFPRGPVFMHLGNQNFPGSPVSPVMGFPESPVLLFSAGGVPPEGANRFPCVRSISTERLFGVPVAR